MYHFSFCTLLFLFKFQFTLLLLIAQLRLQWVNPFICVGNIAIHLCQFGGQLQFMFCLFVQLRINIRQFLFDH